MGVTIMRKWLLRCNLNGYDILQDFLENGSILYKTYDNIKKDDEVFIYGEKPLGAIFLKCIVQEVTEDMINEEYIEVKKSRDIKLKPIENYLSIIDKVKYEALVSQGLRKTDFNGIIDDELGEYLDSLKEDCFDIY